MHPLAHFINLFNGWAVANIIVAEAKRTKPFPIPFLKVNICVENHTWRLPLRTSFTHQPISNDFHRFLIVGCMYLGIKTGDIGEGFFGSDIVVRP